MVKRKSERPRARTLKVLRAEAPIQDRGCPALAMPAGMNRQIRFVPPHLHSSTVEDLRIACGRYGDAAVEEARWSAANIWIMRLEDRTLLRHPMSTASKALALCCADRRARDGFPSLTPVQKAALNDQPTENLSALWEVAADTLADWDRAGCPGLAEAVQDTRLFIVAVERQAQSINGEQVA